jgi:carbon monoxide dehydrogenase subunit G
MQLSSSFAVPAGQAGVFAHFLDPDSMRVSIPGCAELDRIDDTHYRGRLVNEVAHVRFSAAFGAEITQLREPHEVRALLTGEDRKLGSSIRIDAVLAVRPDASDPDLSQVDYSLEIALWGRIGRLGEPIVRRRSQEVEREFVAAFAEICAGGPPGPQNPGLASVSALRATSGRAGTLAPPRPATTEVRRVSWWRRLVNRLVAKGQREEKGQRDEKGQRGRA